MVTEINLENISSGILDKPDTLIVVMCYGASCGPCKFTMPHYNDSAAFFSARTDKIQFFMINAWEPAEQKEFLEQMWSVRGVPTFKLFYNSDEVFVRSGGGDLVAMNEMVDKGITEVYNKFKVKI